MSDSEGGPPSPAETERVPATEQERELLRRIFADEDLYTEGRGEDFDREDLEDNQNSSSAADSASSSENSSSGESVQLPIEQSAQSFDSGLLTSQDGDGNNVHFAIDEPVEVVDGSGERAQQIDSDSDAESVLSSESDYASRRQMFPGFDEDDQPTPPESPQPQPTFNIHQPLPTPSEVEQIVVDYLISEGYREAAEALCQETNLQLPKKEMETLDARVAIRTAIEEGRLEDAINKVRQLCPQLLDSDQEVRFHLLHQSLIELIRNGNAEKALEFVETDLNGDDCTLSECQLDRVEKAFALLAFDKPEESPFGQLLDQSHRTMVSTEVNSALLREFNHVEGPRLETMFKLMVWTQQQSIQATKQLERSGDETMDVDTVTDSIEVARQIFGPSTPI